MAWFRVYDDILDDPKAQNLPASLFKSLINLWCVAKRCNGFIPSAADLSFRLRLSEKQVSEMIGKLKDAGFIDVSSDGTMTPHNWETRQFVSDNVTLRVRKHREKRHRNVSGNGDETLHETDQNRTEQNRPLKSPKDDLVREFDEFWKAYPRKIAKGSARRAFGTARAKASLPSILASLERQRVGWSDPRYIPHPATWLNGERWLDGETAPKVERTPAEVYEIRKRAYVEAGCKTWLDHWGPRPALEAEQRKAAQ